MDRPQNSCIAFIRCCLFLKSNTNFTCLTIAATSDMDVHVAYTDTITNVELNLLDLIFNRVLSICVDLCTDFAVTEYGFFAPIGTISVHICCIVDVMLCDLISNCSRLSTTNEIERRLMSRGVYCSCCRRALPTVKKIIPLRLYFVHRDLQHFVDMFVHSHYSVDDMLLFALV